VKSPAVSRGSQAAPLLDFLREVSCDSLYLVGDIIDGWELASNRVHWPQVRNLVPGGTFACVTLASHRRRTLT